VAKRDTYKYHLKQGNKIIQSGITNDLDRREREHQRERGDGVHIQKVGIQTTRDGAKEWEKQQKRGTP
jgi:predicted GIY-YIG superfamily endonuclease